MTRTGLHLQLLVTANAAVWQAVPMQGWCQGQVCSRRNSSSLTQCADNNISSCFSCRQVCLCNCDIVGTPWAAHI